MILRVSDRRIYIHEVMPRDGLQIEPRWIDTGDKVALVNALSKTGVAKIEVTSFVSKKLIPNLQDAEALFQRIERSLNVVYVALVPNVRGADRALSVGVDEINFVMSASETHNRANMGMSIVQSLASLREILSNSSGTNVRRHGTVATAFGCPFEGRIALDRVLKIVAQYLELGVTGITLADTTGAANPRQVTEVIERFQARFHDVPLTLHFHNTRGMGLANILAAYQAGIVRFDSALGGLGGCPFAAGATGNVCTEDVVNMFEDMGVATGADLMKLIAIARTLPALVGHDIPGQVAKAGRSCDLHAVPLLA